MQHTRIHLVMRRDVVTATPELSLYDAATLMYEHGINGLPVVDPEQHVLGVLGIKDILRVPFRSGDEVFISRATPLPRIAGHLRTMQVRDVMAMRPLCLHGDDNLGAAVHLMVNRGIHPVPVVDEDERLVGIVARAEVIRAVLDAGGTEAARLSPAIAGTTDSPATRLAAGAPSSNIEKPSEGPTMNTNSVYRAGEW